MSFPWISFHWISLIGLFLLFCFVIYNFRYTILAYLPSNLQSRFPQYAPLPDFEAAQLAGFDSAQFNLTSNLDENDHRQLDIDEVRRIMLQKNCTFDEARLIRHKLHLKRNGIDPISGLPMDKKAITSLS